MSQSKDTIYVDVDDEITTIIDKVRASDGRIVALVLPKRASVFQSIVNMKLLKRSAELAKKNVALITTESSLMPLAGAVGLHVASTPQSKPEIPSVGEGMSEVDEVVDEDEPADADAGYTTDNAGDKPVGELSGNFGVPMKGATAVETLSLPDETSEGGAEPEDKPAKKPAVDKKLKVPNFNKFRLRLFLGGLLVILLGAALYVGLVILPKATIVIGTNSSDVNVNLSATLDTSAQTLDTTKMVLPAKIEQQQKTDSQQVATTGKKNNGEKSTGSVTMSAGSCSASQPNDVLAGTGVSTSGLTFISQTNASFIPVVDPHTHKCTWQSGGIDIAAQSGGANYNVSSATFSVAGRSDVTATGTTSGGTDDIIQVVAQADIDGAKQKLGGQDTAAIKSALAQALRQDGLYPLEATFATGTPNITSSNNVGEQANNITVTQVVTYTMFGAKRSDLQALIKSNVNSQINTKEEGISADGLDSAVVSVLSATATTVQFTFQTTATVGPHINIDDLKKQVAGQKSGAARQLIGNMSGVTKVEVNLSPFWVGAIPSDTHKITITITKAK